MRLQIFEKNVFNREQKKMKFIKQIAGKEIEKFRTLFLLLFWFGQSSFRIFYNVEINLQKIIKRKAFD